MKHKEIITAWYQNIDNENPEKIRELCHPDHTFQNPMAPAPLNKEEHIGMMQMMTSALKGQHLVDHAIEDGDWIAIRARWKGKHVGEFEGIAATGNEVEFSFIDIFHIVDGKVKEEYLEMNPLAIMSQIGAVPA